MAIVFACPCGNQLKTEDPNVGLQVRCPRCRAALIVPAVSGATAKPAAAPPPPTPVTPMMAGLAPQPRSPVRHERVSHRDAVDDQPESSVQTAPGYPMTVMIAGIAWIFFGGLLLLNLLVLLVGMFGVAAGGKVGDAVGGAVCGGLLLGLFGAAFMYVGIQSVRGQAGDTIGNGLGSIIFGLLAFGCGAITLPMGGDQVGVGKAIALGVYFLVGSGLLIAGVLALVGRGDYKAWRRGQKSRPPPEHTEQRRRKESRQVARKETAEPCLADRTRHYSRHSRSRLLRRRWLHRRLIVSQQNRARRATNPQ